MRAQWDTQAGTVKRQYAAPVECRVLPYLLPAAQATISSPGPVITLTKSGERDGRTIPGHNPIRETG
jgi:hypothetical protein